MAPCGNPGPHGGNQRYMRRGYMRRPRGYMRQGYMRQPQPANGCPRPLLPRKVYAPVYAPGTAS